MCRKSTIRIATILLIMPMFAQALDFTSIDQLMRRGEADDCLEVIKQLQILLPQAKTDADKADVLWRLSKACVVLGEMENSNEEKHRVFSDGIVYAEKAIQLDPNDPQGYMWHCANVGRECQTHSLMEQASAVTPMLNDLNMILEQLGHTDCSEAWQAKAEIYYHHPFKSNEEAIVFATNAVRTIPKDELRIQAYTLLATLLWERNYSARKRQSSLSDREEAQKWLFEAIAKYKQTTSPTTRDTREYNEISKLLSSMK